MSRPRPSRLAGGAALAAVLVAGGAGCATAHSAPARPVWVYATGASRQLRIFDGAGLAVAANLRLARPPVAMAADAARGRIYIATAAASSPTGSLLAMAAGSARRGADWPLDFRPQALLVGRRGALIVAGADAMGGVLARLDPATGIWRRLRLGHDPAALAWAPGGQLLVADAADEALYEVDGTRMAARARIALAAPPAAVVALPYGHKAFVLCPALAQVAAVDLARAGVLAYLQVGRDPRRMALKPDGGELYVSSFAAGTVSAIATGANQVSDTMVVGRQPIGLAVSPDNQWLYVANSGSNTVDAVSIDDRRVVSAIPVGLGPSDLELDAAADLLFVLDQGSSDIGVIRTGPRNLLSLLPAAPNPSLLQISYDGR